MRKIHRGLSLTLAILLTLSLLTGCGKKNREYVIYADIALAPFGYYDGNAKAYMGLELDVLAAIAADQGFTYTVKNADANTALVALQSGQADGVIARVAITDEGKRSFDFSKSYFDDGQVMAVSSGSAAQKLEDLQGKIVACQEGTDATAWAEANADKYGFTVQYYNSAELMYGAVLNGTCDVCFGVRSVLAWDIKSGGLSLQVAGDLINPQSYAFAVKRGTNAKLLSLFNAGLADIKANGKLAEILGKYGY